MQSEQSHFSRRNFLSLGAATVAGLALTRSTLRAASPEPAAGTAAAPTVAPGDVYAGLPLGVQTYTFRDRSFEKALEAVKNDLKLSYVEIFPNHLAGTSPSKAKALLTEHGITATGWGVVHFGKDIDANRKIFELAKELDVKHITCDPDPDAFDNLDKLTEEYKITADIHDHGPGHRWGKIKTIFDAIKDHNPMIGLCNDTGHFIRAGEDPLRACEDFRGRMHAMHLKDFKKNAAGKFEDCALGEGGLKLEDILKWLVINEFRGDLSLEYEGKNPVEVCQGDLVKIVQGIKTYELEHPKKSK